MLPVQRWVRIKKVMMDIVLERPHLWDGVKNPYLYKGVVILRKDGKEIDRREEEIGSATFMPMRRKVSS